MILGVREILSNSLKNTIPSLRDSFIFFQKEEGDQRDLKFFQILSKIRFLESGYCFKINIQGTLEIFSNSIKNIIFEFSEIPSNCFKKKTPEIPEIFSNSLKNKPNEPRKFFQILSKTLFVESLRFFHILPKILFLESPRFFQILSKIRHKNRGDFSNSVRNPIHGVSKILLNSFKKRHEGPQNSLKCFQK